MATDQATASGECTAMAAGEQHKRLEPFVGVFAAEVKM